MNKIVSHAGLRRTIIAAALLAAFASARAQQEAVVERSVGVGAALLSGDSADRSIYGQYNGYRPGSQAMGCSMSTTTGAMTMPDA